MKEKQIGVGEWEKLIKFEQSMTIDQSTHPLQSAVQYAVTGRTLKNATKYSAQCTPINIAMQFMDNTKCIAVNCTEHCTAVLILL